MALTAEMILTDFGTKLPLQQGRKDALAGYVRAAAKQAGARSAQGWAERQFDLKDYEAKDLLKGNSSEAVWERILKHKNGGWRVLLPIMGAVIGHGLDAFIAAEHGRISREREQFEAQERRLAAMAGDMRSLLSVVAGGPGELGVAEAGDGDEQRLGLGDSEDHGPAAALEPKSYAPRRGRP